MDKCSLCDDTPPGVHIVRGKNNNWVCETCLTSCTAELARFYRDNPHKFNPKPLDAA